MATETAWYDIVGKFRNAKTEFYTNYSALQKTDPKTPALIAEKRALMNRASTVDATIKNLDKTVEYFAGLLKKIGVGGLGVLPVLPVVAVAGAVTLISKWLKDTYEFSVKMNRVRELEQKGVSPSEAARIVEKTTEAGQGLFSLKGLNTLITLAVIGGAAWFFLARKK